MPDRHSHSSHSSHSSHDGTDSTDSRAIDSPERSTIEPLEPPASPSSLTVIRAVARAEYGKLEHRYTATRRKKALGYVIFAAMLPFFGVLLWGSYSVGQAIGDGEVDGLLNLARWYLPLMIGLYALFAALEATKRLVGLEARELLLTTVRERDLVLGLLAAESRLWLWWAAAPTVLFAVAFAVGAGSPTVAVAATLAALALATAAILAGYVLGLGVRIGLRRVPLSSHVRSLLGGLAGAGVVVLSFAGGAYLGATSADIGLDEASLEALTPDGPPPIPIGYYADLFFLGTPLVDGLSMAAIASGVAVVATIPLSLWALVVVTPRLWYADPATSPDAEGESEGIRTRARNIDRDHRRNRPWLAVPSGYVADGIVRRSIRTPRRLSHLLYYAIGFGYVAAITVADPPMAPTFLGGGLVLVGLWLAGGAVGLNPLGEEGSMLEQLVLAEYTAESFVRARLLVGTVVGLPFVLVGTVLLSIRALSLSDAFLVGGFWVLLLPASACAAVGIGTLLPKSEPGRVLERLEARPPEKLAMLVHGAVITVLAAGGGAFLVSDVRPLVRVGGLVVVALLTLLVADGGYRFAVSGLAEYGRPGRPDPIFAVELAVGLSLLGLVLSTTVTEGVLVLVPLSGTARFVVAFVASFAGMALAGATYLLASGRSSASLDVRLPTTGDATFLAIGLAASLAISGALVGAITFLDVPFVTHSIAADVAAGGPTFALVLVVLSITVNAPVEEFLFRNVVQKRLAETISERWAILVASVVFAAVHLPFYLDTDPLAVAVTLTPLAALGAIWGWIYARTENLVVPALCHGLYNAVLFGLVYGSLL